MNIIYCTWFVATISMVSKEIFLSYSLNWWTTQYYPFQHFDVRSSCIHDFLLYFLENITMLLNQNSWYSALKKHAPNKDLVFWTTIICLVFSFLNLIYAHELKVVTNGEDMSAFIHIQPFKKWCLLVFVFFNYESKCAIRNQGNIKPKNTLHYLNKSNNA